jgi:1,4-alpha-glucan branching enzyme
MIEKKKTPGKRQVSVTFRLQPDEGVRSLDLLGTFNDWKPGKHKMKQRKDGSWSLTLRLPKGAEHSYRFLADGRRWITDAEADAIAPNEHGETNGVVRT